MNPEWAPAPNLWSSKTVAILAGGPSMTAEVAERTSGFVRIAINNSFLLAPDAEMLYAADVEWWQHHPEALEFAGIKVVARNSVLLPGVVYVPPLLVPHSGGNSALRAAHIATAAGAERILLFGVDLDQNNLTHWHGLHGGRLRNPSAQVFEAGRKAWEAFARSTDRPEIFNCSPVSALTCFPKAALEDFL